MPYVQLLKIQTFLSINNDTSPNNGFQEANVSLNASAEYFKKHKTVNR